VKTSENERLRGVCEEWGSPIPENVSKAVISNLRQFVPLKISLLTNCLKTLFRDNLSRFESGTALALSENREHFDFQIQEGKKMKHLAIMISTIATIGLSGCAHSAMRGSVAMKTGPQEAHVCLGDKEVKPGDRVNLFENRCKDIGGAKSGGRSICQKVKVGEGWVTELLNEHYSVIKTEPNVAFSEGTIVEKSK